MRKWAWRLFERLQKQWVMDVNAHLVFLLNVTKRFSSWLESRITKLAGNSQSPVTPVSVGVAPQVEGSLNLSPENLLKVVDQLRAHERAFMDLRFKHFTTFVVMTGLIGSAALRIDQFAEWKMWFAAGGVMLTILFWLLDYRTGHYLYTYTIRISEYERILCLPVVHLPKPRLPVRATHVTNLLFLTVAGVWVFIGAAHLARQNSSTLVPQLSSRLVKSESN